MDIKPQLIEGGIFKDDRGTISFVNGFDFPQVKRFYIIENADSSLFRAWQGHKVEYKYFFPLEGNFMIYLIKVDNWDNPNKKLIPDVYQVSSRKPVVLVVPPGYANGIKSLDDNAKLMVFATSTIEDAENIKYPHNYWNIR